MSWIGRTKGPKVHFSEDQKKYLYQPLQNPFDTNEYLNNAAEVLSNASDVPNYDDDKASNDDSVDSTDYYRLRDFQIHSESDLPFKISLHKYLVKMREEKLIKIPQTVQKAASTAQIVQKQSFWILIGCDRSERLVQKLFWLIYIMKFEPD